MKKPLVSVIIPCYNHADYLGEAIGSVIAQTYEFMECIIINDGSTDDTEAIVKQFMGKDHRINYCYQENQGLAASRNKGYLISNGIYIQFLDADDIIAPQKILEQVNIMEKDKTVDVCYSNYQTFSETVEKLEGRYSEFTLGDDPLLDLLFKWERGLSIPIHSGLFRKTIFGAELPFNQNLKAKEDWLMWIKLALKGASFYLLDKDYAFYRLHKNQMTKDDEKMFFYLIEAYSEIFEYLFKHKLLSSEVFRSAIMHLFEQQIQYKNQEIEEKNQEIENLINSTSWRITAPIRTIKSALCRYLK